MEFEKPSFADLSKGFRIQEHRKRAGPPLRGHPKVPFYPDLTVNACKRPGKDLTQSEPWVPGDKGATWRVKEGRGRTESRKEKEAKVGGGFKIKRAEEVGEKVKRGMGK